MKTKWFGLILAVFFSAGCVSLGTYQKKMSELKKTEQENVELKKSIEGLEDKTENLKTDLESEETIRKELEEKISDIRITYEELIQELKEDISGGLVGVTATGTGLTISMGNTVLFGSGQVDLQPKGREILSSVAKVIVKVKGHYVRVDGHSDNVAISGRLKSRYSTNWELSSARAASVVRYLQHKGNLNPEDLVLTAFGPYRPVESNKTAQGRKQNRRVEITLVKKSLYP